MTSRSHSLSGAGPIFVFALIGGIILLFIFPPWGKKEQPPKPEPVVAPKPQPKPTLIKIEKLEKVGHISPYYQVRVIHQDGSNGSGIEVLRLDDGLQTAVKEGKIYEVECTGARQSLVVTQSYKYIKKIMREIE